MMLVQKSSESVDVGTGGIGWGGMASGEGSACDFGIACLMGKCPLFFFLIVHTAP